MGWVYLIVAVLCIIPAAYMMTLALEAEYGMEYVLAAVIGVFIAACWPAAILVALIVLGVKGLERLREGSRLQITWRNK